MHTSQCPSFLLASASGRWVCQLIFYLTKQVEQLAAHEPYDSGNGDADPSREKTILRRRIEYTNLPIGGWIYIPKKLMSASSAKRPTNAATDTTIQKFRSRSI
jgi:hypothetical protein